MKSEPVTYNTRKPNRGKETGTAFVLLKSSLLVYRLSYLKGFLATCLSTGSDLFIPWIIRVIIDNLAAGKIYVPLHLILGAAVFRIAGMRWKRFGILGGAAGVEEMFRNDLVEGFLKAPVKGMHYISSGDFTSRLTRDVEAVSGFLGQGMYDIISTTVKMISALIIMLMIDPVLTLEALIPIVLLAFMTKTFSAYFHDRFRKIQEDAAALNDFVQKTIQSIEHIKARGLERTLSHSFADVTDRFTGGTLQLVLLQSLLLPSVVAMVGLAGVMMLAAGGNAVRAGRISLGDFAAFYSYLSMLLWPVISLGLAFASGERSRSALGRLDEIAVMAKQSDESMDPEEINIPQMEDSNSGRVELNGKNILECHSVRFRYPGLADPAVEAVSFNLKEGEKLLLTGPAASGKSTLLALLHGELTPESGEISFGGKVYARQGRTSIPPSVGFLSESPFIFSGSLEWNITRGGQSGLSVDELLYTVGLEEKISEWKEGRYREVGAMGGLLSGGEKQRLALAMFLSMDWDLLLMDDPLSHLDSEMEAEVLRRLWERLGRRSMILVSGSKTAARMADRIIVLRKGIVAETGTYETLAKRQGLFSALVGLDG